MNSSPTLERLSTIADLFKDTVDPSKINQSTIEIYSLPSWLNQEPEIISPDEIKSTKTRLPKECVLVSRLNPRRHKTWRVSAENTALASTEWAALVPKQSVDIEYLFAVVSTKQFQSQLESLVTGTSVSHQRVSRDDLLSALVPRFSIDTEQKIGELSMSIRNRITTNRLLYSKLQSMAHALFKSWFTDFDPVKAKIEGERPPCIDAETAEQFPDSLKNTNLGQIPDGWELRKLDDILALSRGLSYTAKHLHPCEGTPFHTINSVLEGGGYKFSGIKYYTGDFKQSHRVSPGDVIVATLEQTFDHRLVGHCARIPSTFGSEGIFSGDLFKVESKDEGISMNWIYELLSTDYMHSQIIQYSNGTTINRIPQDSLKCPLVAIPPRELVAKFDAVTIPIQQMCDNLISETNALNNLRETLLPQLMFGGLLQRTNQS